MRASRQFERRKPAVPGPRSEQFPTCVRRSTPPPSRARQPPSRPARPWFGSAHSRCRRLRTAAERGFNSRLRAAKRNDRDSQPLHRRMAGTGTQTVRIEQRLAHGVGGGAKPAQRGSGAGRDGIGLGRGGGLRSGSATPRTGRQFGLAHGLGLRLRRAQGALGGMVYRVVRGLTGLHWALPRATGWDSPGGLRGRLAGPDSQGVAVRLRFPLIPFSHAPLAAP